MARKPVKHVMLDTETLAVACNAAVFQAALVYELQGIPVVRECDLNPHIFYEGFKEKMAFTKSDDTYKWHVKTNRPNLERCIQSTLTTEQFAQKILNAIDEAKEGGKYAIWLWCCGTDFDVPIVKNLLNKTGKAQNWGYSNVRDYRTLRELYKDEVPNVVKNDHSAGFDAQNQYQHLKQILEYLDKWEMP